MVRPFRAPDLGGRLSGPLRLPLLAFSGVLCLLWVARRADALASVVVDHGNDPFAFVLAGICLFFALQLVLAWRERSAQAALDAQRWWVDSLTVCVNIPCYNEDPELLSEAIASVFSQTRLPERVEVIDDGSTVDYDDLRKYWLARVPDGVEFVWRRTPNQGKRHAQMETFAHAPEMIFVTMDSDTVLDAGAIEEGLKPFADARVTSVAGLVLGLNKHTNLLTRLEDLVLTSWQLTMRSAYSQLGSVIVNCGPFALYRAAIVREAQGYLHETIFGRPVQFSDDSLLTLYAALKGRTVQQPTAVAFSFWPERWSHHVRQQVRWTRGSFLRTLWRLRYLPLGRPAFWLTLFGFAQFLSTTAMLVWLYTFRVQIALHDLLPTVAVIAALSYVTTVRTLLVARSDERLRQRLAVYALSPVAMLWILVVYRALRVYGMLTFAHTEWGTRQTVETGGAAVVDDDRALRPAFAFALWATVAAVGLAIVR